MLSPGTGGTGTEIVGRGDLVGRGDDVGVGCCVVGLVVGVGVDVEGSVVGVGVDVVGLGEFVLLPPLLPPVLPLVLSGRWVCFGAAFLLM